MSDGKTYEMMWDCGACGTQKLLAMTHKHCPSCGSPQDPNWRFFPPEDEKVAVEDHSFVGKDLVCDACGSPCSAQATFCPSCGADLAGASAALTREDQLADDGAAFSVDDADAAREEHKQRRKAERAAKIAVHEPPPEAGSKKGLVFGVLGAGALMAFVVCLGVFFFWQKDVSLVNTGHAWSRTIQIEELKTVTKSAWQDEVPRKGKVVSCTSEKRSTQKVADGEECKTRRKDNGDGTFSEKKECKPKYKSKPVYDDKCKYKIDEWVASRKAKAAGKSYKDAPSWPDVRLKKKGSCVGCEREGDRSETYTLTFKDSGSGETLSCDGSLKKWKQVKPKTKWKGSVRVVGGGGLDCDGLKPL
ncbi:MAG: hypothetical protein CL927_20805 [Deltaproteobacteria bacterium]|nr:hypothetical protein [Deltaproteobacteria bacterium]HCH65181.1 hypothetical protein [Deltaproteobacteria bacterium]